LKIIKIPLDKIIAFGNPIIRTDGDLDLYIDILFYKIKKSFRFDDEKK
jgi:hypothetical protein